MEAQDFDSAEEAIAYAIKEVNMAEDGTQLFCVFDRIAWTFLET